MLIEAAKLAPRYNPQLAAVHERELKRGDCNQATLEVARKLVAYLMAVDKSGKPFEVRAVAVKKTGGGGRSELPGEEGKSEAGGRTRNQRPKPRRQVARGEQRCV